MHSTLVHEDHAVGHPPRKAHLMRHHEQGHALLRQAFHHAQHFSHKLGVQRAGDFVAQQHRRFHGQCAGNGYPLLLTT